MSVARLRPATRGDLDGLPRDVAPRLLGGVLTTTVAGETVAVRLTEVEAYHGGGTGEIADPGVARPHGPHGAQRHDVGRARAPLRVPESRHPFVCERRLRPAGRRRRDPAARRRGAAGTGCRGSPSSRAARTDRELARGPGRLGATVGLRHPLHDGIDAITCAERAGAVARLELLTTPLDAVATGPSRRGGRCRGDGCLSVALLDRGRSHRVGLPMGPWCGGRRIKKRRPGARHRPARTAASEFAADSGDEAQQPRKPSP